jgi:hypothetical protein
MSGPGVTASTKPARAKARMTERSGMKLGMAVSLADASFYHRIIPAKAESTHPSGSS